MNKLFCFIILKSELQKTICVAVQRLRLIYKRACIRACYFEVMERNLAVFSHCKRVSIHFDNVQSRFTRRSSSFRSSARFVQATIGSCNSKCMHLERPRLEA